MPPGCATSGELYRLLVIAGLPELRALTAGTAAQPFLDEHNSRMFDSIRSVTSSAVGALEYVAAQRAPPLSLRDWVGGHGRQCGGQRACCSFPIAPARSPRCAR